MIALGDYVLASKYADADIGDPWRIGFVCRIIHTWKRQDSYVIGSENGTWSDMREYRHVRKITPKEGTVMLRERMDAEVVLWGH